MTITQMNSHGVLYLAEEIDVNVELEIVNF